MKTISHASLARHLGEEIGFYGQFTELMFGDILMGPNSPFEYNFGKKYYVKLRENGKMLCMPIIDGDEIELWYKGGLEARKVRL